MKQLWNDYWSRWNPRRMNIPANTAASAITVICVTAIIIAFKATEINLKDIFTVLLCTVIPFVFVWLSIILHPIRQQKQFYLLPLSAQERRQKLRNDYLFRSILHLLVFLLGTVGIFLVEDFSLPALIAFLANGILFGFCSAGGDHPANESVCYAILCPAVLFMNLLILDYTERKLPAMIICVFIVIALIELPLAIGHHCKMRTWFAKAECYEEVNV